MKSTVEDDARLTNEELGDLGDQADSGRVGDRQIADAATAKALRVVERELSEVRSTYAVLLDRAEVAEARIRELEAALMHYWRIQTCPYCDGRGYVELPPPPRKETP